MPAELSHLKSPLAVQAALDEFVVLSRSTFLQRYGYGKSRDFLVRDPRSGSLCDSKAIVGVAYGHQFPERGPLHPADFSGGEMSVVPKLQSLGFEVIRIGEDWTSEEVDAAVASYFEMLRLDASGEKYKKIDFNADLRMKLCGRSKGSVELKHQNISAVLQSMDLPYIPGYKPRGNSQLLLRKAVQSFVLAHAESLGQIIDKLADLKPSAEKTYKAIPIEPPPIETVTQLAATNAKLRLPRKCDFAARDEANRRLGRAGEQWAIAFEHRRLLDEGRPELLQRLDWISDRLGDGAGYDILSFDTADRPRYIEVKTTNGSYRSSFIVSRNEVEFSTEVGDEFFLYRVFQFRQEPSLYMLQGDISKQLHLEPIDYRASFRRIVG